MGLISIPVFFKGDNRTSGWKSHLSHDCMKHVFLRNLLITQKIAQKVVQMCGDIVMDYVFANNGVSGEWSGQE